jgi:8-oxo-dGTP pyrophosphatase MutT (NUDIX family)
VQALLQTRALLGWLVAIGATARTGIALTGSAADRARFTDIFGIARSLSPVGLGLICPPGDGARPAGGWPAMGDLDDAGVATRYVTPKLRASVVPVIGDSSPRIVLSEGGPGRPRGLVGDFVGLEEYPADAAVRAARSHGVDLDPSRLYVIGVLDRLRSGTGPYGPAYDIVFAAPGTPFGRHVEAFDPDDPPVPVNSDVVRVADAARAAVIGEAVPPVLDGPRPDRVRRGTTGAAPRAVPAPSEPPPSAPSGGAPSATRRTATASVTERRITWELDRLAAIARQGYREPWTSRYDHARYEEILRAVNALRGAVPLVTPDRAAPVAADDLLATACAVTSTICVSVVIVDERGRLLLMQRAMSGQWDFISGYADPGDPPVGVAIKEAEEELGLTVAVTGLLGVVDGILASGGTDGPISTIALTAKIVDGDLRIDPAEASDVEWFAGDHLPVPLSGCVRTLCPLVFERPAERPGRAFFDPPGTGHVLPGGH